MKNEDKAAFPTSDTNYGGLTKRELFAAMALQGNLADPHMSGSATEYASLSIEMADALLAALEENQ